MYLMYWIKLWKQPMSYFTTDSDPQWLFNLINPRRIRWFCALFPRTYIWVSMYVCMLRFDFFKYRNSDY